MYDPNRFPAARYESDPFTRRSRLGWLRRFLCARGWHWWQYRRIGHGPSKDVCTWCWKVRD